MKFFGSEGIELVVVDCIPSLLVRPAFLLFFWSIFFSNFFIKCESICTHIPFAFWCGEKDSNRPLIYCCWSVVFSLFLPLLCTSSTCCWRDGWPLGGMSVYDVEWSKVDTETNSVIWRTRRWQPYSIWSRRITSSLIVL